MGLITRVLGLSQAGSELGRAVEGVAEVFMPNETQKMTLGFEAYKAALGQYGAEFAHPRPGWFDRFVNALNRLPRPALAFGTLGLFVYAMRAPEDFTLRMQGLEHVPQPLWWLLGAIVSFYFGARELTYQRQTNWQRQTVWPGTPRPSAHNPAPSAPNPALEAWKKSPR